VTVVEERAAPRADEAVGARRPRIDAELKLTGAAEYAGDAEFARMLHGRPVTSPYAHARIVAIDASAALALPGVRAVLRASDLPIVGTGGRAAEPLAAREVVFAGQPVALVVAESEAVAADAAELVVVDYEPLEPVLSLEEAIAPGSPLARVDEAEEHADIEMHGAVGKSTGAGDAGPHSANVLGETVYGQGDAEAAFDACAAVAEGRFRTAWVHQAYLEPQVATAWPSGAGGLKIHSSTQSVFFVRNHLSRILGIPLAKIEVEAAAVGGGFGGKIGLIDPLVGAAALAVGRPLRVAFTRSEDFAGANPSPAILIDLRVGARADGTLAALEARVLVDNGAFADASPAPLAAGRVGGPYRWDAWAVRTLGVRTNRPGAGAYRGPTATQTAFALESLLDELGTQLGIDPLELRLRNVPRPGDARLDGTTWPRFGLREVLEAAGEHPLWRRRHELPPNEGVGLATGLFPGGKMGAAATVRMDADGGFTIVTGYADVTGTSTSIQSIAAGVIGVEPEQIRVAAADSSVAPQSGVSGGSMVTYCLGSAVLAAAEDARSQLVHIAARELEVDPDSCVIADGRIGSADAGGKSLSLASLGARLTGFGSAHPPVEGHGTAVPPELAPSAAAALVHVAVDTDTGEVLIREYVAIQDVGRAINPSLCEGQMTGGAAQSIGFALYEELAHDELGQILSGSFLNYALPSTETVPRIETVIVEVPSPYGPHGARGIGESAIVPGAPAIANAVAAATGVRPQELPMTRPRVWRALSGRQTPVPGSSGV
jgi:CO/xanthine dehydrogenase Mo-binding subunit